MKARTTILYYVLLFGFLGMSPLSAQEFLTQIKHFSVKDGLPNRRCKAIVQGHHGYIWVGTDNGLARFDGREFKVFNKTHPDVTFGKIEEIHLDKKGNLWVHVLNKPLVVFDPLTEQSTLASELFGIDSLEFLRFIPDFDPNSVSFSTKQQLICQSDGIKFTHQFEANLTQNKEFKQTPTPWNTTLNFHSTEVIESSYDGEELARNFFPKNPIATRVLKDSIFLIYSNNIGVHDSCYFDEKFFCQQRDKPLTSLFKGEEGKKLRVLNNPKNIYYAVFKDSQNRIWIDSPTNLYVFDEFGKLLVDLSDELKPFLKDAHFPSGIMEDHQKNIWISTYSDGIFSIKLQNKNFVLYGHDEEKNVSVRGITQINDQQVVFNSYRGLRTIQLDQQELKTAAITGYGIANWTSNKILIGHHGFRFDAYDLITKERIKWVDEVEQVRATNGVLLALLTPWVDSLAEKIWVGTNDGPWYFDFQEKKLHQPPIEPQFESIKAGNTSPIHENKEGIWWSNSKGLFVWERKKGITQHFNHFPFNHISEIHEEKDHIFWLTTLGGGILKWNRKTQVIRQFTIKDGLPSNVTYAIYADDFDNLWISSDKGLIRFHKPSEQINYYLPKDGICHEEFNMISHFQAKDGRLYFGGLNGVTAFYPKDVLSEEIIESNFVVKRLVVSDGETGKLIEKTQDFVANQEIILQPNQQFFNIDFVLLDFINASAIQYGWRIKEMKENWQYQKEGNLRIYGLPYGQFNLEIKTIGSNTSNVQKVFKIPITVLKPFYLAPLFLFCAIFGIVLSMFGLFKYRTRQLIKRARTLEQEIISRTQIIEAQNAELLELNQTKDQFFAIIAHDLRAPIAPLRNFSDKINLLINKNRLEDLPKLTKGLDNSVKVVQKLLDNLLNWAMLQKGRFPHHPKRLDANEILQVTFENYQEVAVTKDIDFECKFTEDTFIFADEKSMLTIVRNLVDNAIKYTPEKGKVILKSRRNKNKIDIIIEDSGLGMPPEMVKKLFKINQRNRQKGTNNEQGSGLGLILCKELIAINQGIIEVESELGKGTKFIISFLNG